MEARREPNALLEGVEPRPYDPDPSAGTAAHPGPNAVNAAAVAIQAIVIVYPLRAH